MLPFSSGYPYSYCMELSLSFWIHTRSNTLHLIMVWYGNTITLHTGYISIFTNAFSGKWFCVYKNTLFCVHFPQNTEINNYSAPVVVVLAAPFSLVASELLWIHSVFSWDDQIQGSVAQIYKLNFIRTKLRIINNMSKFKM